MWREPLGGFGDVRGFPGNPYSLLPHNVYYDK